MLSWCCKGIVRIVVMGLSGLLSCCHGVKKGSSGLLSWGCCHVVMVLYRDRQDCCHGVVKRLLSCCHGVVKGSSGLLSWGCQEIVRGVDCR